MSEENSRAKPHLNFRKDRNDGGSNTEDHINAYEDLVLSATIRPCVEDTEEHEENQ